MDRSAWAATMVVGRSLATSSAWVGPDSATTVAWGSSEEITWLMVISVSGSIPLATSTMICSGRTYSAMERAVARKHGRNGQ